MDDWRSGSSQSNDKTLLQIARQQIWVHWVMWFFPVVSWVTIFVSAALIRNVKPIAMGLGTSFVFGFIGGVSGEGSIIIMGSIIGSAIGASLTQMEIQKARDAVDAKRGA